MFLFKIKMSKERNLLYHEKTTNIKHSVNVLAALIYYKLFHYFTLPKMPLKHLFIVIVYYDYCMRDSDLGKRDRIDISSLNKKKTKL